MYIRLYSGQKNHEVVTVDYQPTTGHVCVSSFYKSIEKSSN